MRAVEAGSDEDAVGDSWPSGPPEGSDERSETPHPKHGAAAGADVNVVRADGVSYCWKLGPGPDHGSVGDEPPDVVGEGNGKYRGCLGSSIIAGGTRATTLLGN